MLKIWHREPMMLLLCGVAVLAAAITVILPDSMVWLCLSPYHVISEGYLWQLLTYSLTPYFGVDLLVLTPLLLWFGWHLEPVLGPLRTLAMYVAISVAGGLAYAFLVPEPVPLVGRYLVTGGFGAAFSIWTFRRRAELNRWYWAFWAFAACYAFLGLFNTPLPHTAANLASWSAALGVLYAWPRHNAAQPRAAPRRR